MISCGKELHLFGESSIEQIASGCGISNLAKLPMNPNLAKLCDAGKIEERMPPDCERFGGIPVF